VLRLMRWLSSEAALAASLQTERKAHLISKLLKTAAVPPGASVLFNRRAIVARGGSHQNTLAKIVVAKECEWPTTPP